MWEAYVVIKLKKICLFNAELVNPFCFSLLSWFPFILFFNSPLKSRLCRSITKINEFAKLWKYLQNASCPRSLMWPSYRHPCQKPINSQLDTSLIIHDENLSQQHCYSVKQLKHRKKITYKLLTHCGNRNGIRWPKQFCRTTAAINLFNWHSSEHLCNQLSLLLRWWC